MRTIIKKALILTLCIILPITYLTACEMVAVPGENGKSAYEIWLEQGNTGTEQDFLDWLKGEDGEQGVPGEIGPEGEKGDDGEIGKSAYEIWLEQGYDGSEQDFLTWLKGERGDDGTNGKSAYELYCEKYGYTGTQDEWLEEVYKLLSKMTTEELYTYASERTVFIICENYLGEEVSYGSGFFIDEYGTIVTAYHVIDGKANATAYTEDGKKYPITSVLGYDENRDIALLKISSETPFKHFELKTENITAGESVYSFSSPLGLNGSFSSGVVACPVITTPIAGTDDTYKEIQYTAPVSPGSSGGPIFDAYGKVLGLITYGLPDGNLLSFATCVSEVEKIDTANPTTIKELYETNYFYLITIGEKLLVEENDFSSNISLATAIENGTTVMGNHSSINGDAFSITITEDEQVLTIAYAVQTAYAPPQQPVLYKDGVKQNVSAESWSYFETEDAVVYYIVFDASASEYQVVIKSNNATENPYYFYTFYRSATAFETATVKDLMP